MTERDLIKQMRDALKSVTKGIPRIQLMPILSTETISHTVERTPNPWSCLAAAVATVLEIPVAQLIKEVGHDGFEILWPHLAEPQRHRSFHIQEMIDVALRYGYTVTPIEGRPCSRVRGQSQVFELEFPQGNAYRLNCHLEKGRGVLTGLNLAGKPHAVVWDGSMIWDPAGRYGPNGWEPCSYERHLFQIETFWNFKKIC